jgi:hypothetical protein
MKGKAEMPKKHDKRASRRVIKETLECTALVGQKAQ